MTTVVRPSTPADVARIATARRQAEHDRLSTTEIPEGAPWRPLYERGLLGARLHPHSLLVSLVLAAHANEDGVMRDQPYLEGLVAKTGLHTGQVVVALQTIESRGWIRRLRPAPERWESVPVQLTIPRPILARLLRQ